MDAYSDAMMAQDANLSWWLWKVIPLLQSVNYCATEGTTRPMTLARAMAAEIHCGEAEKRGGEVGSIVDHTSPLLISSATATQAIVCRETICTFRLLLLQLLGLSPLLCQLASLPLSLWWRK
jgi:hypothetical protein